MPNDVTDAASYDVLKSAIEEASDKFGIEGNRIFYMSVAPRFFGTIAKYLKSEGLLATTGYNRLMIESHLEHHTKQLKSCKAN